MSNALAAPPAPAATTTPDDVIDRAFVLQMAQVPFIAVLFVLATFVSHKLWAVRP